MKIAAQTLPAPPLSDYVGTYADTPGHTVEIVAGNELFAVLDQAKYRLRRGGVDEFLNLAGQKVPFRRDSTGIVTGYVESGKFHPRLSPGVTPESAALARPRPPGQDLPQDYRYHVPRDLRDGIKVGDISQSELGTPTAEAIVHGILDGAFQDVHSVLLYQHGKLVIEEYSADYRSC